MQKVFISHSSKDKVIIDAFIDIILVGVLAVQVEDIFCTSSDGMKIKSGEDWRDSIKDNLDKAKVTFLIITPNYKESEVCQNEMGAAWVSKATVIPLIVDPIDYKTVGVIQKPKQLEKLLEESSLDRIRDVIKTSLKISSTKIKSDRWSVKKIEFIEKVKCYLEDNPFLAPLGRTEFDSLLEEKNNLNEAFRDSIKEATKLESKIEKLKKAKNREDVKEIEAEFSENSLYEAFESLCSEVSICLNPVQGIVAGIIFKDYSGKEIKLKIGSEYDSEIDDAIANDYIFDDDYAVDWQTTKQMRDLQKGLDSLQNYMSENKDELTDQYEESNDSPFSINNLAFWKENFGQGIYLD